MSLQLYLLEPIKNPESPHIGGETPVEHPSLGQSWNLMMTDDFIDTVDRTPLEPEDLSAIDQLAQETRHPVEIVKKLYSTVVSRLRSGARIRDYLTLLASKKVRGILRKTGKPQA